MSDLLDGDGPYTIETTDIEAARARHADLVRIRDPHSNMGPEYVWVAHRGPGMWCLLSEYVLFPKEDFEQLREVVRPWVTRANEGQTLVGIIGDLLARLPKVDP